MKQLFLSLLLLCMVVSCETKGKEVHFYCRVCGALIANYSSWADKASSKAQSRQELGSLEKGLHIHYDQFVENIEWGTVQMLYFQNVSDSASILSDKRSCTNFPGHISSSLQCNHCKSSLGFFVETVDDEEEFGYDLPEDYSQYTQDDIADMLAVDEDHIDAFLDDTFHSVSAPVHSVGYWSYRYNHKQTIEQFHRKRETQSNDLDLNWSLGSFTSQNTQQGTYGLDTSSTPPIPYYAYRYANGQMCDETKRPRETEVRFEPCGVSQKALIQSVNEVSLCKYVIHVCVPALVKKASETRSGFYAVKADAVIASADQRYNELLNRDFFQEELFLCSV